MLLGGPDVSVTPAEWVAETRGGKCQVVGWLHLVDHGPLTQVPFGITVGTHYSADGWASSFTNVP